MPPKGFFSRFLPGSKRASEPSQPAGTPARKRDRDAASPPAVSQPTPKKQKASASPPVSDHKERVREKDPHRAEQPSVVAENGVQQAQDGKKSAVSADGGETKPESTPRTRSRGSKKEKKLVTPDLGVAAEPVQAAADLKKKTKEQKRDEDSNETDLLDGNADSTKESKNRKRKRGQPEEEEESEDSLSQSITKHSKIRSRFEKSKAIKEALAKADKAAETKSDEQIQDIGEAVVAEGLEPLPQPAPAPDTGEKPTYSSLPAWLANPIKASVDKRAKFTDLGIDDRLVGILNDHGYEEAFAVQTAVIPLLLQTPNSHPGDLCISAATGSGKTLAYVLPLVKALEATPAPVLRGLIVVPTRELVKQAREACELCAIGSGLRIGTAVGNVAIKDEQRTLMRVDSIYDPEEFRAREERAMTAKDWTEFNLNDYMTEAETVDGWLHGYVNRPEPNVDILICTPGRLVDHIRYTKGFTLRHVEWLVADEADRLLNESFQEWVEVVMKSLDERKSPLADGSASKLLADLNLPLEKKEPRKVVLSATLTTDLSKLNSLRLVNPKLVVIGAPEVEKKEDPNELIQDAETKFTLPSTLKEYSVSVGDGSEKPLYLLQLLLHHIEVEAGGDENAGKARAQSESSSDDESSSVSSDEDSSDSDNDSSSSSSLSGSESDFDSDSDSESESDSSSDESDSSSDSSDSDSLPTSSVSSDEDSSNNKPPRNTVLVFTKSSEAAARLSRLLCLMHPSLDSQIGTILKSNKSSASRRTLRAYRAGLISIIVATDRAARGLDLPNLRHVVNYDMPTSVTTYVHRVGRTARAGRDGLAWTLVAHREGRWFSREIVKGSEGKIVRDGAVEKVHVRLDQDGDQDRLQQMRGDYEAALEELEIEVKTDGRAVKEKQKERKKQKK